MQYDDRVEYLCRNITKRTIVKTVGFGSRRSCSFERTPRKVIAFENPGKLRIRYPFGYAIR